MIFHCAVCTKKFPSFSARQGHWKFVTGGRLCMDTPTMIANGYYKARGAWQHKG